MTVPAWPVAIGGVGGSGTRVVASALSSAGWYLGGDLNEAQDNLWFTTLFKHLGALSMPEADFAVLVELFVQRMSDGFLDPARIGVVESLAQRESDQHAPEWFAERLRSMTADDDGAGGRRWGWKEPNTHVVLERLERCLPGLRYVHVARSGLDMAVSSNQNQPRLWGAALGVPHDDTPASSLRFWCAAQRRVLATAARMPDRFLFVRFEDLCADPLTGLERLFRFCGVDAADLAAEAAAPSVRRPDSLGRGLGRADFDVDRADVAYVRSLGFAVD